MSTEVTEAAVPPELQCRIPKCEQPAIIDHICSEHAGRIYTRERDRVIMSIQTLIPSATPDQAIALVSQLEHLMQMMARTAASGHHFEMRKAPAAPPGAAEEPTKVE